MYLLATASKEFEAHAFALPNVTERWLSVRDYPALMETLRHVQPSILLLDLDLPGLPRGAQISALRRYSRKVRMIGVYRRVDDALEIECFREGGFKGCCWLGLPAVELARVIAAVEGGEVWIKRSMMGKLLEEMQPASPVEEQALAKSECDICAPQLTRREHQIAMLVCHGHSNKQIGRELGISERTVKAHLTEIFRKLGISDRLMLAIQLNSPRQAQPALPLPS